MKTVNVSIHKNFRMQVDQGPLHDRCPKCHNFSIMTFTDEYVCVDCYLKTINESIVDKDRELGGGINIYHIPEELQRMFRVQPIPY